MKLYNEKFYSFISNKERFATVSAYTEAEAKIETHCIFGPIKIIEIFEIKN